MEARFIEEARFMDDRFMEDRFIEEDRLMEEDDDARFMEGEERGEGRARFMEEEELAPADRPTATVPFFMAVALGRSGLSSLSWDEECHPCSAGG